MSSPENQESVSQKPLPPLRPGIEPIQVNQNGSPMVLLKDQEGLNPKPVLLSLPAFVIAALMDGKKTLSEISAEFTKSTGAILKPEELEGLVKQLDEGFFLLTEKYLAKRKEAMDAFKNASVREPFHMGPGYPENALELGSFLGKFFQDPKGPGKGLAGKPTQSKPPRALMCPHIDFHRGGPAYAWAFQALSDYPAPDVIIGLGVAHVSPNSPWITAKKDYATPYGAMALDKNLYEKIESLLWYEGTTDEWVHRSEHSLEFPALWLRYVWRDKTPAWVPILTSSFESFAKDVPPSKAAAVNETLENLGAYLKSLEAQGKTVMIVAGVDLAHVGPRFGDQVTLDKALEEKIEKADKEAIEDFYQKSPDDFYLSVMKDDHWRKWCGLSALYTAARLIRSLDGPDPAPGKTLTYGQAADPMGGIVSYFSGIIPRK